MEFTGRRKKDSIILQEQAFIRNQADDNLNMYDKMADRDLEESIFLMILILSGGERDNT